MSINTKEAISILVILVVKLWQILLQTNVHANLCVTNSITKVMNSIAKLTTNELKKQKTLLQTGQS